MRKALAAIALIAALLFGSMPAQAITMQARDVAGNTVTIAEQACANADVLKLLPGLNDILAQAGYPKLRAEHLRSASVVFEGKHYAACWFVFNDTVIVMDDGGQPNSIFPVPVSDFRRAEDI